MVIVGLAIAFSASWRLTLVTLAAFPFMIVAQMVQASQAFGSASKVGTPLLLQPVFASLGPQGKAINHIRSLPSHRMRMKLRRLIKLQ